MNERPGHGQILDGLTRRRDERTDVHGSLLARQAGLTTTVRGGKYSITTTRIPFPIVSAGSDEYALKASLPPLTAIITSPRRPGPMTPVTRPTRPIICWSSTVRTILPPTERSAVTPWSYATAPLLRAAGGVSWSCHDTRLRSSPKSDAVGRRVA